MMLKDRHASGLLLAVVAAVLLSVTPTLITVGLVSTALARLAMFAGIQRIGSGQIALLGPVETLLSVAWAVLFLGERLSPLQWAGGLLVLASAALALGHRPLPASPGPQNTAKGA